jgi:hypothetical protein
MSPKNLFHEVRVLAECHAIPREGKKQSIIEISLQNCEVLNSKIEETVSFEDERL